MPLVIKIRADLILPEEIVGEEEFVECFKDNRQALIELLDEDFLGFVESFETADNLVESFEWMTEKEALDFSQESENKTLH